MKKILLVVLIAVCATCTRDKEPAAPSTDLPIISYGTSFGECLGYCLKELVIEDALALFTKSSWQPDYPDLTLAQELSAAEWSVLLRNIHWNEFQKQPDIIGCPDCADGGAEWIEITYPDASKNVLFEYGATVPGNEALLLQLRKIHARMEAALDAAEPSL